MIAREREAVDVVASDAMDLAPLARALDARMSDRNELRAAPLLRQLQGVRTEMDLRRLAGAVPLRLEYRREQGTWLLHAVRALDRAALREAAYPGAAARRVDAIESSRTATAALEHPEAVRLADLLREPPDAWDDRVIRAISALAVMVEAGDARPARVFSAEVLGDSKALRALRPRLERIVGPLDRLGIRDTGAVVLCGGSGAFELPEQVLRLDGMRYLGLAPEDVLRSRAIEIPDRGVLVVENLTPFHVCLDAPGRRGDLMVLWSGGFPSRGVVHLIRRVLASGYPVRVWCDLDLGGVRIVRLIDRLAPGRIQPVLMEPDLVDGAAVGRPLSPEQRAAITRDIAQFPDALLSASLSALLRRGVWIEQETLLARVAAL